MVRITKEYENEEIKNIVEKINEMGLFLHDIDVDEIIETENNLELKITIDESYNNGRISLHKPLLPEKFKELFNFLKTIKESE